MQKKISAGIVYYKNKKAGLLIKTKEGRGNIRKFAGKAEIA
ncbi:unnamed protein product [marine sediment metagenome]|uniref:Uncharacterized protein n=1 Tax=marine sediment metagenome TaxID=412755 RepID=X1AR88_9ZZZZ